jgi:hypothetical protein
MKWQYNSKVKSSIRLAHGGKLKYWSKLWQNFNPRKCRNCRKLLLYFYNIGPRAYSQHFIFFVIMNRPIKQECYITQGWKGLQEEKTPFIVPMNKIEENKLL